MRLKKGILVVERRCANEKKILGAVEWRYANEEAELDVVNLPRHEENEAMCEGVGAKSMIY